MYVVILWRFRLTIVAMEKQQWVVCIVDLSIAVNIIKILSVAQEYCYGEFMSPATIKRT
jgi:hypothetical protein